MSGGERVGRRAKVSVRAVQPEFRAGEPITAQVSVSGSGGLKVERCQVELQARLRDGRTRKQGLGALPVSVDAPVTLAEVISLAEVAGLAGAVLPPSGATRQVTLARAPSCPSGKTRRVSVEYQLVARLGLASGRQIAASAPVVVVNPRCVYQSAEGAEYFRRAQRCDLDLVLPAPHGRPGETIEGLFRVRPGEPVYARLVLRQMYVLSGRGAGGTVPAPVLTQALTYFPPSRSLRWYPRRSQLARGVMLSGPAEFPFRIPVPGKVCPTLVSRDFSVRHYVCCEVHYRARQDSPDVIAREVNIHSA